MEQDVAEVKGLKDQVSRIDERTKNTAVDVAAIRGEVGRLTDHLLTEPRGFSPTLRGRSRT